MTTHELTTHLDDLNRRVATYGVGRFERELAEVAELASRRGAAPAVAYLVADRTAPEPVRARALARVSASLRAIAEGRSLPAQPRPLPSGIDVVRTAPVRDLGSRRGRLRRLGRRRQAA